MPVSKSASSTGVATNGASPSIVALAAASAAILRARDWYSGPCFRGSAYSRGLMIQYSPDDGPYQAAPPHVASAGSRASSYEVDPRVAFRVPRRPPRAPEAPEVPDVPVVPDVLALAPAPGVRPPRPVRA